jgi:peptidoglycan/LPS O-acetylase OafA/YrhL
VYVLVVMLNLGFLYAMGSKLSERSPLMRKVVLLGKYSLLSYFVQILVLQVLFRELDHSPLFLNLTLVCFVMVTAGTMLVVELTEFARHRFQWADGLQGGVRLSTRGSEGGGRIALLASWHGKRPSST